jgi:hypothetical protein
MRTIVCFVQEKYNSRGSIRLYNTVDYDYIVTPPIFDEG